MALLYQRLHALTKELQQLSGVTQAENRGDETSDEEDEGIEEVIEDLVDDSEDDFVEDENDIVP